MPLSDKIYYNIVLKYCRVLNIIHIISMRKLSGKEEWRTLLMIFVWIQICPGFSNGLNVNKKCLLFWMGRGLVMTHCSHRSYQMFLLTLTFLTSYNLTFSQKLWMYKKSARNKHNTKVFEYLIVYFLTLSSGK